MVRSWRALVAEGGGVAVDSFKVQFISDSIWASHRVSSFGAQCGLSLRAQAEIAIVTSELVTNAVKFAQRGFVRIEQVWEPQPGVRLTVDDDGSGIEDPERAVHDGFSEGRMLTVDVNLKDLRGLGSGLAAVKRLSDALEISRSEKGGARVVVYKWSAKR